MVAARDWQRRLWEAGYVGLSWPKEYGGQGASLTQQVIVAEELARAQPGFLSFKSYESEDGEFVAISEWASEAAVHA